MTTTSDEFFTPAAEIALVRKCLGEIDLDPASCAEANVIVGAKHYYTKQDNGLILPWEGVVFCNPPYSRGLIDRFAWRFMCEYPRMTEGILLVNANTSSSWFQSLLERADAVCFCGATPGCYRGSLPNYPSRIKFVGGASTARAASAYFYQGKRHHKFMDVFADRGVCLDLRHQRIAKYKGGI